MSSVDSKTASYKHFKSTIAQQKVITGGEDEKTWKFYDWGPKDVKSPLICLHDAAGTADVFYKLMLALCPQGYRIVAVQYPAYWSHLEWVQGFEQFLNTVHVEKCHLFGASLGGFLSQCFIQHRPNRVESLILCNSFCDTEFFNNSASCVAALRYMPEFYLKRVILENFPAGRLESDVADSVDFVVNQLDTVSGTDVASRLTLTCISSDLQLLGINSNRITIIDCMDEVVFPDHVRQEVYKRYPNAKQALLKSGGNFPYLSRADEVTVYVRVHLRTFGVWPGVEPLAEPDSAPADA